MHFDVFSCDFINLFAVPTAPHAQRGVFGCPVGTENGQNQKSESPRFSLPRSRLSDLKFQLIIIFLFFNLRFLGRGGGPPGTPGAQPPSPKTLISRKKKLKIVKTT